LENKFGGQEFGKGHFVEHKDWEVEIGKEENTAQNYKKGPDWEKKHMVVDWD